MVISLIKNPFIYIKYHKTCKDLEVFGRKSIQLGFVSISEYTVGSGCLPERTFFYKHVLSEDLTVLATNE